MKNTIMVLVLTLTMLFSFSAFAFGAEGDTVNVSLIKYSGSDTIEEHDEYDGVTVTVDGETHPVLSGAVFSLFYMENDKYTLVEEGLITDENGYIKVENLSADKDYYFQETAPAEGFLLVDDYVAAVPWTEEEVITYAESKMKELPPDEHLDGETAVTPDTAATAGDSSENPPTGDTTPLFVFVIVLSAAFGALLKMKNSMK